MHPTKKYSNSYRDHQIWLYIQDHNHMKRKDIRSHIRSETYRTYREILLVAPMHRMLVLLSVPYAKDIYGKQNHRSQNMRKNIKSYQIDFTI